MFNVFNVCCNDLLADEFSLETWIPRRLDISEILEEYRGLQLQVFFVSNSILRVNVA